MKYDASVYTASNNVEIFIVNNTLFKTADGVVSVTRWKYLGKYVMFSQYYNLFRSMMMIGFSATYRGIIFLLLLQHGAGQAAIQSVAQIAGHAVAAGGGGGGAAGQQSAGHVAAIQLTAHTDGQAGGGGGGGGGADGQQ